MSIDCKFMYFQKNMKTICSKSTKKLPWGKIAPGAPHRVIKNEVFQIWPYCIYFQKNVTTRRSKTTENLPQGSIAPMGLCQGMKDEVSHTGPCYISISCKFCVLSEKQKYCMSKIKHKLPPIIAEFQGFNVNQKKQVRQHILHEQRSVSAKNFTKACFFCNAKMAVRCYTNVKHYTWT